MLGAKRFCKGYPQWCSQNLWVGLGRSGSPCLHRQTTHIALCPRGVDSLVVDGLGSRVGSARAVIQQIGLPVSLSRFSPKVVAFVAISLERNKDLQGNKEGCATDVV